MPKHLIIDGYNLLGAFPRRSTIDGSDGDLERESLLEDLGLYQQRRGYLVTVVFDAWRRAGSHQRQEHRSGVTVIFSRQGERADQIIQRMARTLQEDCVVVSSDHDVINVARAHGALTLRSQEFLPKLRFASTPPSFSETEDGMIQRRGFKKKGNPRKLRKSARNRIRSLRKF